MPAFVTDSALPVRVILSLMLAVTVGCSDPSTPASQASTTIPAADDSPDEPPDPATQLVARCGGVTFTDVPPDLDEFPPLDAEAQALIDEFAAPASGMISPETRWSMAHRTDDELVVFGQPTDPENDWFDSIEFEMQDGTWVSPRSGDCQVRIDAPGLNPALVGFDPDNPPSPDDTELSLLIVEQACASGLPIGDRDVVVLVTETPDTVSVLALVAPFDGAAACPDSNPWHPITVELDTPLGNRQLIDTHRYPPQPVEEAQK